MSTYFHYPPTDRQITVGIMPPRDDLACHAARLPRICRRNTHQNRETRERGTCAQTGDDRIFRQTLPAWYQVLCFPSHRNRMITLLFWSLAAREQHTRCGLSPTFCRENSTSRPPSSADPRGPKKRSPASPISTCFHPRVSRRNSQTASKSRLDSEYSARLPLQLLSLSSIPTCPAVVDLIAANCS